MGVPNYYPTRTFDRKKSDPEILISFNSSRRRKRCNPDFINKHNKMLVHLFGTLSRKLKTTSTRKLNHPHFIHFVTTIPCLTKFPSQSLSEATALVVLLIHGRLGLEEPFDDGIMAVLGCQKQLWCLASGAAAQGQLQTEPNGTKGRNILTKFVCLKIEMSWGHRKTIWINLKHLKTTYSNSRKQIYSERF